MAERVPMARSSDREGQELLDPLPQERYLLERGERLELSPEREHGGCDMQEILTLPEAADLLRVSERTLQRLMQAGAVPHATLGRVIRFRRTKLLAWLDAGGARRSAEPLPSRGRRRRPESAGGRAPDVLAVLGESPPATQPLDTGAGGA